MSETTNKEQDLSGVTLLGNQNTKYKYDYDPSVLQKFELQFADEQEHDEQVINIDFFEWVGQCPKTGQPDLASFHISYIPNRYAVESKSLKLFMYSFQRHGAFHEQVTHMIMQDLVKLLDPKYLSVYGDFNSRGGCCLLPISIYADEDHQDLKKAMQIACMTQTFTHKPRTS